MLLKNQCFYAFQKHDGNYQLSIRDLQPSFDWSISQSYSFCIEKVEMGCQPPCVDKSTEEQPDLGCDTP